MSRRIEDLTPDMQAKVNEWRRQMDEAGIDYIITCTRRIQAEQNALYAKGRTEPGPKVTWTLNSRHLQGTAFDFVIIDNGQPDWKMKNAYAWNKAVSIGRELGLKQVVGKNGKPKEFAHLEM